MSYYDNMNEDILESLRGVFLSRTSLEDLPEDIWKRIGALNTWGTNAIEGNTLSRSDVEKLLLEDLSVSNKPMRDVLETIRHQDAFRDLIHRKTKTITLMTVLELHEAVFQGIKPDAGQLRRVNVFIHGSKHRPPRMEKVLPLMEEWESAYNRKDIEGEPVFMTAAWMHHEFETIHPFSDGNGRVGRLLLNLHFIRHNWPPLHILPENRKLYLHYLEEGNKGNLSGLYDFFRVLMGSSLIDLLDQVGTKLDEKRPLKDLEKNAHYSAKYLALRAGQGLLPAVKNKGDWHTSERALKLYCKNIGRK